MTAERLHKAAESITAVQQRYTPLAAIDFGPRPAQLPVLSSPITNSPAAKIINSNVVVWPVITHTPLWMLQRSSALLNRRLQKKKKRRGGSRCSTRSESRLCNGASARSPLINAASKDHVSSRSSKLTSDSVTGLPRRRSVSRGMQLTPATLQ